MRFFMQYVEKERLFPVYAVEGWADFGTNQCEEIHRLLLELDQLEGPLILHCRGGFGRTGICRVLENLSRVEKGAGTAKYTRDRSCSDYRGNAFCQNRHCAKHRAIRNDPKLRRLPE